MSTSLFTRPTNSETEKHGIRSIRPMCFSLRSIVVTCQNAVQAFVAPANQ
jgi:hypothetical protein